MEKIWQGHLSGKISKAAESFNASISFDKKMYKEDIEGSMVHAEMLGHSGIIEEEKAERIISALSSILSDIEEGKLEITDEAEDIHSFVESVLTERIGDDGKMLHTARSRNDQVALDTKLYTRKKLESILSHINGLMKTIAEKAKEYEKLQSNVVTAARRGYVDLIIEPADTRKYLVAAFEMLYTKCVCTPDKKHGTK